MMFGNIETVFEGQFTNGNFTIPNQNTKTNYWKMFGLSLTTNMPPKNNLK